jgi:DNA adenine methylase
MPLTILENIYKDAKNILSKSVVSHAMTKDYVEAICRCNTNKAPIRFLMSCLLAKIDNHNVDIRKPYKEIKNDDTYSGRFYDEKYIEIFVHKYKLPCNPTTAYLTPAFRNLDRILTTDLILVGRPREIYEAVLIILDSVYKGIENPKNVLQEIIRFLLIIKSEDELRMKQLISDLKQPIDMLPPSSEDIVVLLSQHLDCKHSSRLPVLIVASAYQSVKEYTGEVNKKLEAHTAADKQTGSIGDVEIILTNDDKIVTCYEMKDKRVTKTDIDIAIHKISKIKDKTDNYIFVTTDVIEHEVFEYAKGLYEKIGVEFAILDCIGFIRHFLHFFHRKRVAFLNIYQDMVLNEPTSSVSQPLKEAFLALRRSLEADRR